MRTWLIAVAAGATLSAALPAESSAQAASTSSRGKAQAEQARREAERDRLRDARTSSTAAERQRAEQERLRAAEVRRAQDTRLRTEQNNRARAEAAARERERERLRMEREAYDRYNRDRYDRYDDRYDDRWDYRDRDGNRWRESDGPSFCRSGAGHPVHGRQWCRDKGFALGHDQWGRDTWGDIFVGSRRDRRYERYDQTFSRNVLADLLGAVLLNRFENYGRNYARGSTTGRWMLDGNASVLQLYMGNTPIARLVDLNRDGRVDNVQLRY